MSEFLPNPVTDIPGNSTNEHFHALKIALQVAPIATQNAAPPLRGRG